jgi:hypothetical protein
MATASECKLCGMEDSWRQDCHMSRCVWVLADPELLEHMNMTIEPDAKRWIFTMLDSLPHAQFVTLVVTMWAVWYAKMPSMKMSFKALFQLICLSRDLFQR